MKLILKMHLLVLLLLLGACVSVNLHSSSATHKAAASYKDPAPPFESFHDSKSDAAWHNPHNGNTISYFSNCNDPDDPKLQVIRQEMLQGIDNTKIDSSENLIFNGRQALRSLAAGSVDGVSAKMDVLVFKKDSCVYGISYVGVASSFDADHSAFDDFLSGFKAP